MKVFVGLTEIAGYSSGLVRGLTEIGHEVCGVDVEPHPYAYGLEGQLQAPLPLRWAMSLRRRCPRKTYMVSKLLVAAAFPAVVFRFDVVVLLFGGRFVSAHEGRLARMFGCRFVHVFLGSDARPASIDAVVVDPANPVEGTRLRAIERSTMRRVRALERAADLVVALPAYAHYLSGPFVSFHWVGFPVDAQARLPDDDIARPLRVLHAPSHPRGKGTDVIREAVKMVRSCGIEIQYVELQSVTNAEVKAALLHADVLLDQVFSDTPLAALGSEATASGVVAVVGTLHRHALWTAEGPVSVVVDPEAIAQVLFDLCANPVTTRRLGDVAQRQITTLWAPARVAARLMQALDGDVVEHMGPCCDAGFGNHEGRVIELKRPDPAAQQSPFDWSANVSGRTTAGTPTTSE